MTAFKLVTFALHNAFSLDANLGAHWHVLAELLEQLLLPASAGQQQMQLHLLHSYSSLHHIVQHVNTNLKSSEVLHRIDNHITWSEHWVYSLPCSISVCRSCKVQGPFYCLHT